MINSKPKLLFTILATTAFFAGYFVHDSVLRYSFAEIVQETELTSSVKPGNINSAGLQQVQNFSEYRQRFLLWYFADPDTVKAIGQDTGTNSDKYIIYRCDSRGGGLCGGWGDRVKGMIAGYLMANLTGRNFKIELLNQGCDLSYNLMPHLVNWSLPMPFHDLLDKSPPDTKNMNMVDNQDFFNKLKDTNFSTIVGSERFVYFKANLDHSPGFKVTTVYKHELSWMDGLTRDQILGTVYKRLFVLHPRLHSRLQEFLLQTLPTPQHKLICAHIRMGRTSTIPKDSEIRFTSENLHKVWKFIAEHSKTDFHKVFVMSDSADTLKEANLQSFKSRLVTTSGPILHVERSENVNGNEMCAGQEKIVFDQHVLMNCDVLLLSNSGLSRMAAYIRGQDKDLYCLMSNGDIISCACQNLSDIYHNIG